MVKEKPIKDFGVDRRFRYDYYIEDINTCIEVNGGSYGFGRHTFGEGYERDLMKLNLTQQLGLKMFQFTYSMLLRKEYTMFL